MTARNLKIRITVGPEDSRQVRRASETARPVESATVPAPEKPAATPSSHSPTKWLLPAIAAIVVLAGLGYFLADSGDMDTTPLVRTDQQTVPAATDPKAPSSAQSMTAPRTPEQTSVETASVAPPPDAPRTAGAVGAPQVSPATPPATTALPETPSRFNQTQADGAIQSGRTNRTESTTTASGITPSPTGTETALPTSDKVARATFATAISRLEPTEDLTGTLSRDRGLSRLYFFTELRDLRGQRVRHRWLINGERIADIPINVGSDRYRASSNMRLTANRLGTWEVQVLDSQGKVLHASRLEYR